MGRPAARVTDMTVCPMVTGLVPHVGGPIAPPCQVNVIVGGMPQARVTDKTICAAGGPSPIVTGSATVLVGGKPAARIGDMHAHGGVIITGFATVLIGDAGAGSAPTMSLAQAAAIDNATFAKRFEQAFALSLEDALNAFEAQTGKKMSIAEARDYFVPSRNPLKYMSDDINITFRSILNSKAPRTIEEAAKRGWTLIPQDKNAFHRPEENLKYVSPDGGHMEAIFNKETGQAETNPAYAATANFFGPDEAVAHTVADVIPWGASDGGSWLRTYGKDKTIDAAHSAKKKALEAAQFTKETVSELKSTIMDLLQ